MIVEDYLENHYEISVFIDKHSDLEGNYVSEIVYNEGTGGLYILAKKWTDEFTEKYKDIAWGEEIDYHDTLEDFLSEKLK